MQRPPPTPLRALGGVLVAALVVGSVVAGAGCVPRPRMCTATSECEGKSACVAGRCQLERATVKPAVDSARRIVARPVDVAFVRSGDASSNGALPVLFALGKDRARLFLRFSVPVVPTMNIVEAYVVLHRATVVDDDPAPISLHATRIVEAWNGGSVSWALQPHATETRSPSTLVEPGGSTVVRVDVRELVRQWARRDPTDHGIAIEAENETTTGTTFALSTLGVEHASEVGKSTTSARGRGDEVSRFADVEPYLELYVR